MPMPNSMTGYGGAEGQLDGVCYAVELKAVNNRYLKTIIKLPETIAFVEDDVDKLLRRNLSRGTVNCVVRRTENDGSVFQHGLQFVEADSFLLKQIMKWCVSDSEEDLLNAQ